MASDPTREDPSPSSRQAASTEPGAFERDAEQAAPGLWAEYWDFLIHNKKWWLTPIVILLLLAGLLVILAGTVGPFIYPGL
jgi:hypothetical protein